MMDGLAEGFGKQRGLSSFLKVSTLCGFLRLSGRAFPSLGAAGQKAPLPHVLQIPDWGFEEVGRV